MTGRVFGSVAASIWDSDKMKACSERARLVFLWMLTTEFGNAAGTFRFVPAMIPEIACPTRATKRIVAELCDVGLAQHDRERAILRINQYIRHFPINSWQHATAAANALNSLGTSSLTQITSLEVARSKGFLELQRRESKRSMETVQRFYNTFDDPL